RWAGTGWEGGGRAVGGGATSAPASGWLRAAAAARWAMPTWQTTLVRPTRPMSAMICSGPATQPTRQPIIRSSLDADPTVIVRSVRPQAPAAALRVSGGHDVEPAGGAELPATELGRPVRVECEPREPLE